MKTKTKPRLFRDHLKEQLKNPRFKKAFDEYDTAIRLAMAVSLARGKAKLTQKELAEKIGSTQPALALKLETRLIQSFKRSSKLNGLCIRISGSRLANRRIWLRPNYLGTDLNN